MSTTTYLTDTGVVLTDQSGVLKTSKGNILAVSAVEGMRPVRTADVARRGYLGSSAYIVRPEQIGKSWDEVAKAGAKVTRLDDITPVREWMVEQVAALAGAWAHETCEGGLPWAEAWNQVIRLPQAAKGCSPSFKEFKLGMYEAGWFQSRGFFMRQLL